MESTPCSISRWSPAAEPRCSQADSCSPSLAKCEPVNLSTVPADYQFRSGKDAQGIPPKLVLPGWDFVSRAGPLIGRECETLSRIDVAKGWLVSWRFAALAYRRRRARAGIWYFDHGVVFAFARMFLVAWDQQNPTVVTVGIFSKSGDLSSVVDVVRFRNCYVRAGKNQGLQVDNGTSVLHQEPTVNRPTISRIAHDLLARIDCISCTAGITSQDPRSVITPFFQRKPCRATIPGYKVARPTTSPASLTHLADELSPPKVPRSVSTPRVQKKAWK